MVSVCWGKGCMVSVWRPLSSHRIACATRRVRVRVQVHHMCVLRNDADMTLDATSRLLLQLFNEVLGFFPWRIFSC